MPKGWLRKDTEMVMIEFQGAVVGLMSYIVRDNILRCFNGHKLGDVASGCSQQGRRAYCRENHCKCGEGVQPK